MRDKLGRFIKGEMPWNKGKHPKYMQGNQINKGRTPWNKGTKGVCKAWNKGKKLPPLSKEHKRKLSIINTGSKHPRWKGFHKSRGYIYIYKPDHPFATIKRCVKKSRLVMEKYLGRYLTREERIHHKGIKYPIGSIRNKQDDRIENLKLFPNESEHQKFHHKLKKLNVSR